MDKTVQVLMDPVRDRPAQSQHKEGRFVLEAPRSWRVNPMRSPSAQHSLSAAWGPACAKAPARRACRPTKRLLFLSVREGAYFFRVGLWR